VLAFACAADPIRYLLHYVVPGTYPVARRSAILGTMDLGFEVAVAGANLKSHPRRRARPRERVADAAESLSMVC
jgi:hypothetical protein